MSETSKLDKAFATAAYLTGMLAIAASLLNLASYHDTTRIVALCAFIMASANFSPLGVLRNA